MLIADDQRRYVQANGAACLLLRLPRHDVLERRIDDLTPPELHDRLPAMWSAFLREGTQSGTFELLMPDGPRMRIDYSATANVEPGRHLSILLVPAGAASPRGPDPRAEAQQLTPRERQVLTLIAMGDSGPAIARALAIAPATVESHVRHCLEKLGARNRAHAIALGLQHREIELALTSA
ncbi:MAG: hypothetical protein NVSMB51_17820 [Solirubrobacteraceae bacterium]